MIRTEEWNYTFCLIQGRVNFFSDIVIQLSSARPGLSILGMATEIHSKISKDLLSHNAIKGLCVFSFLHCGVEGDVRAICILICNIK